jgi:hypothetical protein
LIRRRIADLAGAAGHVDINPTAQVAIGTITIAANSTFTFTTAGNTAKPVAAGSVIRFVASASTDATVASIAVTLTASLA